MKRLENRSFRPSPRLPSRRRRSEEGVSLIESLIAAVLLAFVAVSLFPLLHRSVWSNISGSDSNQETHHDLSELERLLSLPFDSPVFEMADSKRMPEFTIESEGTGDRMLMGTFYYDPNAKSDTPASSKDMTHRIATGEWITDRTTANGIVLWKRTSVLREYSYADIGEGVIDASDSGRVVAEGHPNLFDSPLKQDALESQVNFKEEDVTIEGLRAGAPRLQTRLARAY